MKIKAINLIGKGYFLNELPPPFSSLDFANKYKTIFTLTELQQLAKGNTSECSYYSIPKAGYNRRVLGIPNPLHYTLLAEALAKNSAEISRHLKSKISCSSPVPDILNKRAIATKMTFSQFRRHCFLVSEEMTYELKVDISKYYSTIYTHIIPWALHGRSFAKKNIGDKTLLGNLIDKKTRDLQSGQTMGIPIGPDTSLIISELIGSRLDKSLTEKFKKLKAARYIDDYYFYFSSRSDAEKVLKYLQSLFTDYLLNPNEEKTTVKEFPFNTDSPWAISLRTLKATCFKDHSVPEQEGDIRQFFSAAFDWAEKYPKDEVMKFAVRTLMGVPISKGNWDYFQAWLIKMGLYDPMREQSNISCRREYFRILKHLIGIGTLMTMFYLLLLNLG